jgi:hypothetical protein
MARKGVTVAKKEMKAVTKTAGHPHVATATVRPNRRQTMVAVVILAATGWFRTTIPLRVRVAPKPTWAIALMVL